MPLCAGDNIQVNTSRDQDRPVWKCLFLPEFIEQLEAEYAAGREFKLDPHLLPQQAACNDEISQNVGQQRRVNVLHTTVKSMRNVLGAIETGLYGMQARIVLRSTHSSQHESNLQGKFLNRSSIVTTRSIRRLCALSLREYRALGMSLPHACAHLEEQEAQ